MKNTDYAPRYSASRALIVGINNFIHASPLSYAVSDADAVRDCLIKVYDFPASNIICLYDEKATRKNIMSAYMSFSGEGAGINDRLLIFYAGHGYTSTGIRGDVGFLVPHDGNVNDLSSLIRWDDLTYNSELIRAKHILFIMDACYGGLALSRSLSAGSMRFLKDMLLRPVRQVLTAGKADQTVADAGGPRPSHSVFTGHLLDALEGRAATEEGIITANGIMAYVYDKVSKDIHSHQTPHFGFFDGDGDFIFNAPILSKLIKETRADEDILISIPSVDTPDTYFQSSTIKKVKEYIAESKDTINLHDLSISKVRRFNIDTSKDKYPISSQFSVDEFIARLKGYEDVAVELKQIASCLAYWGTKTHVPILEKLISRATDDLKTESGLVIWNALRWHPIILITYSAGIAAASAKNFRNMHAIFTTQVTSPDSNTERVDLIWALGKAILDIERSSAFKQLPGHDRNYVPRSEYLFKYLQPDLDDLFFLGKDYEHSFDVFEIMLALTFADASYQKDKHIWGPVGRFGWKYSSRSHYDNPLRELIAEASKMGTSWPVIQAGFFGGDVERFNVVAKEYEHGISKLGWGW